MTPDNLLSGVDIGLIYRDAVVGISSTFAVNHAFEADNKYFLYIIFLF